MAVAFDAASESRGIVYGLCHPVTGELRYVGKTAVSPRLRLQDHVLRARHGAQTRLSKWLRSLDDAPIVRVLEREIAIADLDDRERAWIARLRDEGVRLTNGTEGGDGGPTFLGRHHTPEARAAISAAAKGRDMSRAIAASAEARRGKPLTDEHRAKVGRPGNKNALGYRHTPAAKERIRASNRARNSAANLHTPTATEKMRATLTGRSLSPDHRLAITAGLLRRRGRTPCL